MRDGLAVPAYRSALVSGFANGWANFGVRNAILPLFAFTASLVVIPAVPPAQLQPAFWGVAIALPHGTVGLIHRSRGLHSRREALPASRRLH